MGPRAVHAYSLANGLDLDDIAVGEKLTTDVLLRRYRLGLNAIALGLQERRKPEWVLD